MAERVLSGKIKQLVYTTEELSQSPLSTTVIDNGVLVYEKTSSGQIKCKIGDGNNVWSGLNYINENTENNNDCVVANIDNEVNYKVNSLNITSNCEEEWKEDVELPYEFFNGDVVVYNNKLSILGSGYYIPRNYNFHVYNSENNTWDKLNNLPFYISSRNHAIEYNNKLHAFYDKNHYIYDGTSWNNLETLSFSYDVYCKIIEYNNEIHILNYYYKYHYKWNGNEWTELDNIPSKIVSDVIIYNDCITCLCSDDNGKTLCLYEWDGSNWNLINTSNYNVFSSSNIYSINIVNFNNNIYCFKDKKCTIWNGESWSTNTMPYSIYNNNILVYNNKIHIFGLGYVNNTNHVTFDGVTWDIIGELPYPFSNYTSVVIYNNKLYSLGGENDNRKKYNFYSLNNSNWEQNTNLPDMFANGCCVTQDDILYVFGLNNGNSSIYKYESYKWTNVPYGTTIRHMSMVLYNNDIHMLGNYSSSSSVNLHRKFNLSSNSFETISTLPYNFYNGSAVVYNDEIHILGGEYSSNTTSHYKFNGSDWIEVSILPYEFYNGSAVVYNDEIHILGGSKSGVNRNHYKFNIFTSTWEELKTLPYDFYNGSAIVYDNKIHMMGSGLDINYKSHYSYGKDMSDLSNADILTVTIDDNKEIPLLINKMNKNNPTGTGSLSINRAEGTTVGKNSVTLGTNCIASGYNAYAEGWNTFAARYKRYNITSIVETTVDDTIVHTLNIENSTSGWNGLDSYIYLQGYDNNNNKNVIFKTKIIYCYEATDDNGMTYYQIRVDESNINAFSKDDVTNTNYYNIFVDYSNDYDYTLISPHAEGNHTIASGDSSHAEGYCTTASGDESHAEGYYTTVSGNNSHAEGRETTVSGNNSHAEGRETTVSGNNSHAEGYGSNANGNNSHAEGYKTTVSGAYGCHAEGYSTTASGDRGSHAEGYKTTASGEYGCHAEGHSTTASGKSSHAEGRYTIASSDNQHVQGKYNIKDSSSTYAHIVGGGTSDSDRKNIHTLDWNGNAVFAGDVTATDSNGNTVSLLNSTINSDTIVSVSNGGTGYSTIADTTYTTARYRASSLNSSETTPTTNGVIAWTYE